MRFSRSSLFLCCSAPRCLSGLCPRPYSYGCLPYPRRKNGIQFSKCFGCDTNNPSIYQPHHASPKNDKILCKFFFVPLRGAYMCTGYFDVHRNVSHCTLGIFLRIVRCFCADSYLFHNSPIQQEKQKSTAQNRTKTTNCPNSVSYGAWWFFSPYGSCPARAIRNRFVLFGFQSVSAASRSLHSNYTVHLAEKARTIFPT